MELVLGMFVTHAIMKDGHVRGAGPGKAEGGRSHSEGAALAFFCALSAGACSGGLALTLLSTGVGTSGAGSTTVRRRPATQAPEVRQ